MIQIYLVLAFLLIGLFFGALSEKIHYRSIHRRELGFCTQPVLTLRHAPDSHAVIHSELVLGSVVVSVDYFKRFTANLKKLFGGEIHSYSSLLDRARREALLRLKESCADADLILNLRFETSTISNGKNSNIGSVEILVYATALWYCQDSKYHLPNFLEA